MLLLHDRVGCSAITHFVVVNARLMTTICIDMVSTYSSLGIAWNRHPTEPWRSLASIVAQGRRGAGHSGCSRSPTRRPDFRMQERLRTAERWRSTARVGMVRRAGCRQNALLHRPIRDPSRRHAYEHAMGASCAPIGSGASGCYQARVLQVTARFTIGWNCEVTITDDTMTEKEPSMTYSFIRPAVTRPLMEPKTSHRSLVELREGPARPSARLRSPILPLAQRPRQDRIHWEQAGD